MFLIWYSTKVATGLPGMLGLRTLGKIWNCGVLTSSMVIFFVFKFDNSSCVQKFSIAPLPV